MGDEGIEGRGKQQPDGRGGEEEQGPSYKVLNSCFACPISFPASLMGEKTQGTGKSRQRGGTETIFCGQRPICLCKGKVKGRWQEVGEGLLDLVMKTRQGEWQY